MVNGLDLEWQSLEILKELDRYEQLFRTTWKAQDISALEDQVHFSEIDLLLISAGVEAAGDWPEHVHVVCFSEDFEGLPGPIPNSWIHLDKGVETEQFLLPDVLLAFHRQRHEDLRELSSVRGWRQILPAPLSLEDFSLGSISSFQQKVQKKIEDAALISNAHTKSPFAVVYEREGSNLGVAWLPCPIFNRVAWVELIAMHRAERDRERFPEFGDWTKSPDWMIPEEEDLLRKINALEEEKRRTIARIEKEISRLSTALAEATLRANMGRRRLLTAQGDELVEEVSALFQEWGFAVEHIDEILEPQMAKREDLRLTDPYEAPRAWEAIVEVRGYSRSAGTTADLQRLARFATFFQQQKGRLPDKRFYVVNGQLELPPAQRQQPLASASEDIEVFAEEGGVVLSTLDLFRAAKMFEPADFEAIRQSIKCAGGAGRSIPLKIDLLADRAASQEHHPCTG